METIIYLELLVVLPPSLDASTRWWAVRSRPPVRCRRSFSTPYSWPMTPDDPETDSRHGFPETRSIPVSCRWVRARSRRWYRHCVRAWPRLGCLSSSMPMTSDLRPRHRVRAPWLWWLWIHCTPCLRLGVEFQDIKLSECNCVVDVHNRKRSRCEILYRKLDSIIPQTAVTARKLRLIRRKFIWKNDEVFNNSVYWWHSNICSKYCEICWILGELWRYVLRKRWAEVYYLIAEQSAWGYTPQN